MKLFLYLLILISLYALSANAETTLSGCKLLPQKPIVIHSKPKWKADHPTTELPPSPDYKMRCAESSYSIYRK